MEDREIIKRLEDWFPRAKAFWEPHHNRYTDIKRFTKSNEPGAQWDETKYKARIKADRITLTENLLGPFVNREVNKLKRSDFSIQVKPKDDGTDPKLAQVRQGLHRGIQQMGGWKQTIAQAADDLVTGGLCAARMLTDYADPKSFKKEIQYRAIEPTRMFHGDGTHQEPDFSDVTDSLVYEPYSFNRFKSEFNKDAREFLGKSNPVWGSSETGPWVNEYFLKDESPERLVLTMTGKEMYLSDLKKALKNPQHQFFLDHPDLQLLAQLGTLKLDDLIAKDAEGEDIIRDTTACQIWWVKLAGKEVLKKEKWPGYWIPNFIGTGRTVIINGKTFYYGLAEPAKDAQMLHNFGVSAHAERLAYAPKIPIWMPIQGVPAGHQQAWDNINVSTNAVGYYNAFDAEGRPIPPPQRAPSVQSDPGFLDISARSEQGIKGTLGMWESALSAPSEERSGIAIQTREQQADNGNYDWGANLAIMAEHMGYATDEILGKVIDVPTQVRIVGEDDKEEVIWAASLEENDPNADGYFNLNQGKFDLLCKMSPGTDTKRDEALAGMQNLFQTAPELAMAMADFWIKEQDWRLSDEASKRAKKFIGMKFPGLIEPEEGQQEDPEQIKAQMAQQQIQMQQMQEVLQKMGPELERLKIENAAIKADKRNDTERVNIEWFKAKTDASTKGADVNIKGSDLTLKADKQQHDKAVDRAELALKVEGQAHQQQESEARFGMDADKHIHQKGQDYEHLGMEGEKMRLDHAAKISQQGKPTGATGNDADTGRKTVKS